MVTAALHIAKTVLGLVTQYRLAKSIEQAPLVIVAGDSIHLSHPLSVGDLGGSLPFR